MKLPRLPFGLDGYIAIGLSLLAAGAVAWLAWGIHDLGKKAQWEQDEPVITGLRNDVAACKATVAQQVDALKTQNAAIDQMAQEAAEKAKEADQALRKAQAEAKVYKARAAAIARAKPGPDVCASARSLIVETLAEER